MNFPTTFTLVGCIEFGIVNFLVAVFTCDVSI